MALNSWEALSIADLEAFIAQSEKQLKDEQERYKTATKTIRTQMNYASEVLAAKVLNDRGNLDGYYITLKKRTKDLKDV